MVKKQTISQMIALHLKSMGVQSIFGVPGGGSSLDLIDAAEGVGIKFYLVKSEDAAVIMACVYGELTNSIGVALVTKGPGLSNACLLYTSPSPRDGLLSRMPSSA